jgi:hypothetical protein
MAFVFLSSQIYLITSDHYYSPGGATVSSPG